MGPGINCDNELISNCVVIVRENIAFSKWWPSLSIIMTDVYLFIFT